MDCIMRGVKGVVVRDRVSNMSNCKVLLFSGRLFITARVRSTKEGNVLTRVCVSVHTCGGGRYPISGLGEGGTPSQVWPGVPHLRSGWGVPHPRSGQRGTPSQVLPVGYPPTRSGRGTPQTWDVKAAKVPSCDTLS